MATLVAAAVATSNGPDLRWYLALGGLTLAMSIGAVWMLRVWNDVKGEGDAESSRPEDLLGPLAQAYAAGQMSEEEYQRIKRSIGLTGLNPVSASTSKKPPEPSPESPE